jgi:hypothetical protein
MASHLVGVAFGSVAATVTLASSANPAVFGQPVALTAAASSSAASGLVTFYDGATVLGIRTLTGGLAALTTSLLSSGTHLLRANYGGSTSASITLTVNALPANGFQLVANPGSSSGTVNGPASMTVGDFNEDGKADVAVANSKSGNVSVLLGNGDGTFRASVNYSIGGSPGSVVAGDFNGDGHTDLAVGNGQTVSILLGNGDGTFKAPAQYTIGTGLQSLAVADFNGDGKADLVVASAILESGGLGDPSQLGSLVILLGNGDGTFQPPVSISSAGGNAVVAGDFNGDRKADRTKTDRPDGAWIGSVHQFRILAAPTRRLAGAQAMAAAVTRRNTKPGEQPRALAKTADSRWRHAETLETGEFLARRRGRDRTV